MVSRWSVGILRMAEEIHFIQEIDLMKRLRMTDFISWRNYLFKMCRERTNNNEDKHKYFGNACQQSLKPDAG